MFRIVFILIATSLLMATAAEAVAGECTQKAVVIQDMVLYDRLPVFSTGSGWQLGDVVATIPARSQIVICDEATLGVVIDVRKWYLIQYGDRKGWGSSSAVEILSPDSNSTKNTNRGKISADKFLFSSIAYAQPDELKPDNSVLAQLPQNYTLILYAFVFICGLFGMLAKVIFDEVDRGLVNNFASVFTCLNCSKCIKAFVVSPIVFISFLKTGDFSSENSSVAFVIYACMAFQNGFFWQTVIPSGAKSQKPALTGS